MPGVKVVYTRKTDKALGPDKAKDLQARADIANKAGGDLFISIHVNAAKSTAARGVETLIMGESPKEQRYNENALFENNREDLIDMSDERTAAIVRAYIQNLQFTYGEYSMAIARCIQNNYLKAGRHSRGIKPQLLRVLYATDTLWHVMEHLEHLDEVWQRLHELLTEKGVLIVAVPNCSSYDAQRYGEYWAAYDVPRHLWHFTPGTIQQLASRHGFIMAARHPMPFDAFYVSMLSEKHRGSSCSFLKGMFAGTLAWFNALGRKERSSSMIYVFRKKR